MSASLEVDASISNGTNHRLNKENIPSRAYIAFKDEEQLALFSKGYDGHVFRDKAGAYHRHT